MHAITTAERAVSKRQKASDDVRRLRMAVRAAPAETLERMMLEHELLIALNHLASFTCINEDIVKAS